MGSAKGRLGAAYPLRKGAGKGESPRSGRALQRAGQAGYPARYRNTNLPRRGTRPEYQWDPQIQGPSRITFALSFCVRSLMADQQMIASNFVHAQHLEMQGDLGSPGLPKQLDPKGQDVADSGTSQ